MYCDTGLCDEWVLISENEYTYKYICFLISLLLIVSKFIDNFLHNDFVEVSNYVLPSIKSPHVPGGS